MDESHAIRDAAASWSLAGDQMLLGMLQNLHKKIMTKCQETNAKMTEMMTALDDASISLQNVNNKFMALSNSQFVESRVYEDDADVSTDVPIVKEPSTPVSTMSQCDQLRASVLALEARHEYMQLVDFDSSGSDDEEEPRMVLKPVSPYVHRPLPYIIGSYQWTNKWHVGLVPEDSDSDSSVSKHEANLDEYSESEPEEIQTPDKRTYGPTDTLPVPDTRMSTSSSEIHSEASAPSKPSAADIAAEIARRLGGSTPIAPERREQTTQAPKPMPPYRPSGSTAHIFSDEPPPLDQSIEPESSSEEDDIFAELHKTKPPVERDNSQSRVAGDLFGNNDIFSDFANVAKENTQPKPIVQKSTLFEDDHESDLFSKVKPAVKPCQAVAPEINSKKPVGGISLFGSKAGAESIGAAILQRNRKKSSVSDESDNERPVDKSADQITKESHKNKDIQENSSKSKETNIFDDLFAKPEKSQNEVSNVLPHKPEQSKDIVVEPKTLPKKVDIFSDNIFDDIDDIFSTPVITKTQKKDDPKKLFADEDADDLFADMETRKVDRKDSETANRQTSNLFDNKDGLFNVKEKNKTSSKISEDKKEKQHDLKFKSVFESDDEHSNDVKANITADVKQSSAITQSLFGDEGDDDIFSKLVNDTQRLNTSDNSKDLNTSDNSKDYNVEHLNKESKTDDFDSTPQQTCKENKDEIQKNLDTMPPEIEPKEELLRTTKVISIYEEPDYSNENRTKTESSDTERVLTKCDSIPENMVRDNQESIDNGKVADNMNLDSNRNIMESIIMSASDTMADIFAHEPPDFEKPKEPKKSKNINALFEDDSDDESLFFKTNDVITDEKPETFQKQDGLFDIFHDEPPDIDIDFIQKTKDDAAQVDAVSVERPTSKLLEDVSQVQSKMNEDHIDIDFIQKTKNYAAQEDVVSVERPTSKLLEDVSQVQSKMNEDQNDKVDGPLNQNSKIGKLKSINLNINVNTLLPGAAPTKPTKRLEEADGPNLSPINREEKQCNPKLAKEISFEEKPETNVLDNKLSKERAKIQVKRRPSTRKVRLQASRISGIDFGGEDSTDNSSPIDNAPKQPEVKHDHKSVEPNIQPTLDTTSKRTYILNDEDIFNSSSGSASSLAISKEDNHKETVTRSLDTSEITNTSVSDMSDNLKSQNVDVKKRNTDIFDDDDEDLFGLRSKDKVGNSKKARDIFDDDIFSENTIEKDLIVDRSENKNLIAEKLPSDDFDDLFGTSSNSNAKEKHKDQSFQDDSQEVKHNIQTLGKAYQYTETDIFSDFSRDAKEFKTQTVVKKVESLFIDDDDEEMLFNPNKKFKKEESKQVIKEESKPVTKDVPKQVTKTKSIFNSDDEDDLFFGKSNKSKAVKNVEVKKSLFDDSDDDDGLFSSAVKKPAGSSVLTARPKDTSKSAESVSEDPLSLFGGKST